MVSQAAILLTSEGDEERKVMEIGEGHGEMCWTTGRAARRWGCGDGTRSGPILYQEQQAAQGYFGVDADLRFWLFGQDDCSCASPVSSGRKLGRWRDKQ
jgi:hypothetical protein